MTNQIPDTCVFEGRRFVVTGMEGNWGVVPSNQAFGIETVTESTANWSGRINHFVVHQGRLFLFKVEVNLAEGSRNVLPPGARREIVYRYELTEVYESGTSRKEIQESRVENLVFDNLPLAFDGVLHLLSHPDRWARPTAGIWDEPEERVALTFENGRLGGSEPLPDPLPDMDWGPPPAIWVPDGVDGPAIVERPSNGTDRTG
ncbi:MAG: hypothetical protein KBH14_15590 [Vicinamibacteria bacterium]|nr:hypothetical protein [Vicinamibacteria bacterium]